MAASTEVAYTQTQTEAFMDDTTLNPVTTEKRCEVQVTLVFDGVTFNPGHLLRPVEEPGNGPDRQDPGPEQLQLHHYLMDARTKAIRALAKVLAKQRRTLPRPPRNPMRGRR